MKIRMLYLILLGVLSGCTSEAMVRAVLPECPSHADTQVSRAAECMTAAAYEIAIEKAKHVPDVTVKHANTEVKPRFEKQTP